MTPTIAILLVGAALYLTFWSPLPNGPVVYRKTRNAFDIIKEEY